MKLGNKTVLFIVFVVVFLLVGIGKQLIIGLFDIVPENVISNYPFQIFAWILFTTMVWYIVFTCLIGIAKKELYIGASSVYKHEGIAATIVGFLVFLPIVLLAYFFSIYFLSLFPNDYLGYLVLIPVIIISFILANLLQKMFKKKYKNL